VVISGVEYEKGRALIDAKMIVDERGEATQVHFAIRKEKDIVRDKYNSIKRRDDVTELTMNAYPMDFNPSERKIEKAGLVEKCDLIIYTARQDWLNAGLDFDDINAELTTVKLGGSNSDDTYEIRDKGRVSHFREEYLYFTFGLRKK
jgi:regulation of enolase protein 1 (concanavalin A-like superfamily)